MTRLFYLLRNRDVLAGLTIVAVCAVAWWLTTGFDEVPAMLSQNVQPTFFPRLVIAIAALLGGLLVADGIRRGAGGTGQPRDGRRFAGNGRTEWPGCTAVAGCSGRRQA